MGDIDYAQFDPELRRLARLLPKGYALHRGLTFPRALMTLAGWVGRVHGVEVDNVNADVTVRIHRSTNVPEPGPALLWIHGGATLMGTAAQEDRFCRKLANFTDVTVVAVDHRLAPEHPYPTPLEDCYAALQWLSRQNWADPARIAVGGASAGGGLTAAVAQVAYDRGEVKLALQMMVYPMLDDRTGAKPESRRRVMWSAGDNQLAWQWYLAGADPETAAPARRADLSDMPPAWIGVGTRDLFYDECRVYGERLRKAGVSVHEEIADGAFHTFDLVAPNASVSQRFFASQCRAVRSALVETS
ncbi:alpha/beta hydrolase [Mycobacterium asiaticum]|uniref:Alpha/beta hydrolase n=1 Tax=Mycobacterium asiaticum TaxID=1790 RepID=A0A1A3PAE4_MYCAS|nr:alpha/beta hydrolase [Mycobacterium asiaticum]OBK30665.1 alpha/beta hydrolase [Mycobacterium asiaticum]